MGAFLSDGKKYFKCSADAEEKVGSCPKFPAHFITIKQDTFQYIHSTQKNTALMKRDLAIEKK